jgi:hypothetical protein
MMENLLARGEAIARDAQQQKIADVAQQLRSIVASAAVQVEDGQVLVRGRGLMRRWLTDPSFRFLASSFK